MQTVILQPVRLLHSNGLVRLLPGWCDCFLPPAWQGQVGTYRQVTLACIRASCLAKGARDGLADFLVFLHKRVADSRCVSAGRQQLQLCSAAIQQKEGGQHRTQQAHVITTFKLTAALDTSRSCRAAVHVVSLARSPSPSLLR